MRYSCAMISPRDTSLEEEGGADVDGAEQEEGVAEFDYRDRSWASLHLTVAKSMAHMMVKWSEEGKGKEKWCRILVITEGKMSLSRDAESR